MPSSVTPDADRTAGSATFPQRIVSLVPSQTELLAALGLDARVVGVTRFCVRPGDWKRRKAIVGGTKNVDVARVRALAPDLVLANREENTREDVEALAAFAPVLVTDVATVAGASAMIREVGARTGTEAVANALAGRIANGFAALPALAPLRAAYFIWREPWMVAGGGTFIGDVLRRGGFANVFEHAPRYPAVSADEVVAARPDVLLFSSEPYPFRERHLAEWHDRLPGVPCAFVDGEACSWYGPRLLETPEHLRTLRRSLSAPSQRSLRDA